MLGPRTVEQGRIQFIRWHGRDPPRHHPRSSGDREGDGVITELTMVHKFGVTMTRAQVCEAIHAEARTLMEWTTVKP